MSGGLIMIDTSPDWLPPGFERHEIEANGIRLSVAVNGDGLRREGETAADRSGLHGYAVNLTVVAATTGHIATEEVPRWFLARLRTFLDVAS